MAISGSCNTFGWDRPGTGDGAAPAREAVRMHRRTAFAAAVAALVIAVVLGSATAAVAAEQPVSAGWDTANRGWHIPPNPAFADD